MPLALRKKVSEADIADLIADVRDLRREVAGVLRRVRPDVEDTWSTGRRLATRLSASFGDNASTLYKDAARQGVKTFRTVNRQLRDQPVAAVLVAFGIGLILSRLAGSSRE